VPAALENPPAAAPPRGSRREAVRGVRAMVGVRLGTKALGFLGTLILARILLPGDFGLFAFALAVLGILGQAVQLEVRRDLVRLDEGRPARAKAYLLVQAALGLVLGLFVAFGAGPISAGLGHPEAAPLLLALSCWPLLEGIRLPAAALLEVEGRFPALARIEGAAALGQLGVGVALAFAGAGAFALLGGFLAAALGRTLACQVCAGPGLRRARPSRPDFASVGRVGLPLLFAGFLTTFYWRIDDVLVFAGLGAAAAGYYALAFQAPHALLQASEALGRVSLGVLGARRDLEARRRVFSVSMRASLAILAPALVFGCVHGETLFALLFGPKWVPAAGAFTIFLLLATARGATAHWADVATLEDRFDLVVKSCLALALALPPLGFLGLRLLGIEGMALGVLAAWALPAPFYLSWTRRRLSLSYLELLGPTVLSACAALALGFICVHLLGARSLPARILVLGAQGALFFLLLATLDRDLAALARETLPALPRIRRKEAGT